MLRRSLSLSKQSPGQTLKTQLNADAADRRENKMIERFVNRLKKIGVEVELVGNYPWVYLDCVNGVKITEKFCARHGFTAFFIPVKHGEQVRFSNRRRVFAKVRQLLMSADKTGTLGI